MKKHQNQNCYRSGIAGGLLILTLMISFVAFGSTSHAQAGGFQIGQQVSPAVNLYLHSGPGMSYPSIAIMKQGQPATITGAASFAWYPLDYQGLTGWAAGNYLQPYSGLPAPATPTANQEETKPGQRNPAPNATPVPAATATPVPEVVTATKKANYPYAVPTTPNAQGIMLGMFKGGNVRAAPTLNSAVITGWWYGRKVMVYGSVTGDSVNGNNVWYIVGKPPERTQVYYVHSSLVTMLGPIVVPQPQYRLSGHWIDVNLTQQSLTAFDGQTEVMHTLISSGAFTHTTAVGYWKIYYRLEKQEMKNPDPGSGPGVPGWYDLKDVPYPQYFNPAGEAIHGTFWHDNFGTPMSHGCVNATTPAAEWIYKNFANIGTVVVVHF
jgi:L,D-transpeptidase catalytic domain/Bacterial SH3 domain